MKTAKRLSLVLVMICLFSVSYLVTSASAQGGPPGGPPGGPDAAPIDVDLEDPCASKTGDAQDDCYISEDEALPPENDHCEDLHQGKPIPDPSPADIARYEAEYRANMKTGQGRLNDSTYAELEGKGFSRAEIDCHVHEMAEAAQHDMDADDDNEVIENEDDYGNPDNIDHDLDNYDEEAENEF